MPNLNYSEVVDARVDQAWRVMRDFAAVGRTGPAESVEMEGDGAGAGSP